MKTLLFISMLTGIFAPSAAQSSDKLVWFGIDFTASKFVLVQENPQEIVNRYLPAINYVILTEPQKYDLRSFFNASEVQNNIDPVLKLNSEIDPSTLVSTNEQKLEMEKVNEMIRKYNAGNFEGTGLVFIAENLNKATGIGSYYVCLFNIRSREVIEAKRMQAPVGGIGFRNYWVSSVYKIMKKWALQHGYALSE